MVGLSDNHQRPSNMTSMMLFSTASQLTKLPLAYMFSYEAILIWEKKGIRSVRLSTCVIDFSRGCRAEFAATAFWAMISGIFWMGLSDAYVF